MPDETTQALWDKLNKTHNMVVEIRTALKGMNGSGGLIHKVAEHDKAIRGMSGPQWFMKIFVVALIAAVLTFAFSFITPAHPQEPEFWDHPKYHERLRDNGRYMLRGTPTQVKADLNCDGNVTPLDAMIMINLVFKGLVQECDTP